MEKLNSPYFGMAAELVNFDIERDGRLAWLLIQFL